MTTCKTLGQAAYERDCRAKPNHWCGRARPPWSELDDTTQQHWESIA